MEWELHSPWRPQTLDEHVLKNLLYENLPPGIQARVTEEEYDKHVVRCVGS